jgi:general L-amino acid transport system permease protein
MSDTSFIRTQMLPPQTPPVSERGAVKWLRENLFSGWLNSVLTVLAVVALYSIVTTSLPWVTNGVWNAGSLVECRAVLAAMGEGTVGACWAVLTRWNQFVYGFYPIELYWRPTLAAALMIVALAPVLYYGMQRASTLMVGGIGLLLILSLWGLGTDAWHIVLAAVVFALLTAVAWVMPKRLIYLTLAFPALGFYLLWGGSVWGPLGAMAGFVVLGGASVMLQRRLGVIVAASVGAVLAVLWWLWLQGKVTGVLHGLMPIGLEQVDSDQFGGFLLSFVIGVTAISASLPIGILLALGRRSDMPLIKMICVGFIEFVRGVPLITMLFTASLLLQYFLPPQTNFDLILRVIILVTLFAAAYIAEVVRGGLAALPRGQYEAADALGLDYWQAQRLIILPQALKISIPGIVSSFIGLFKDTTLVALVGLADPLQGIRKIVLADTDWKGIYWEPFIFVALIFFVVCFSMSRYSMYLERKLKTDHR